MISTISGFFRSTREVESSPRDAAVEGVRRVWNKCIKHPSTVIEQANYSGLHIKCSDLGGDQVVAKSRFFAPLGESGIPLPHLEDKDTQEKLENQRKYRRSIKENPMAHDLNDHAQSLANMIRVMFQTILRHTTQTASGKYLSLRSATDWRIREVFPLIINEQFLRSCVDPPVPTYAYVYNEGKPTDNFKHSHTIIALTICEEPDERLTRLEVLAIVAVTITRLEGDTLPKRCKTVPVMVISTFGRMKARILTAHYESEGLIIRKTPLLDFAEDGPAEANMTIFMRCMASKAIDGTYICSDTLTSTGHALHKKNEPPGTRMVNSVKQVLRTHKRGPIPFKRPPATPTSATYPGASHDTPTSPMQDPVFMSSTTPQEGSEAFTTFRNANPRRTTPIEEHYRWLDDLSD